MPGGVVADPSVGAALGPWLWGGAAALLVVAAVVAALEGGRPGGPRISSGLTAVAAAVVALLGIALVLGGAPVTAQVGQVLGFRTVDVAYDQLSGVFLVALGLVGVAASVAAIDGLAHEPVNRLTAAAFPVFLLSMLLVFGSADAFAFLVAWEAMAVASAILVIGARPTAERIRTGYFYLAVTHAATAALVIAFALLASPAGSLDFAAWPAAAGTLSPQLRDVVFVLLVVGFGTKAGAMPFHVWLPRAHPVAPAHVSALMSGVMIKTGIYGLMRVGFDILGPGPEWWALLLLVVGGVSAVMGVLYALMEHDLKRLLAQSSIENVGVILIALGAAFLLRGHAPAGVAAVALVGALFHVVNHGLFKGLLFLGAGSIQHAVGDRNLNRLGGLARVMPLTALCFGVGAAAISGLPPLNGFASEWLTFQSLLLAGGTSALSAVSRLGSVLAVGGLALTTGLAVACFVKATGMTFLALPRSRQAADAHDAGRPERAAMAWLAALCVGAGLAAGFVVERLTPIATAMAAGAGSAVVAGTSALAGSPAVLPANVTVLPAAAGTAPAGSVAPLFLAMLGGVLAVALVAVARLNARTVRRGITWTCGILPDAHMEYSSTSYAKPIRLFFRRILRPERALVIERHPGSPVPRSMRYSTQVTHVLDRHVLEPAHRLAVAGATAVRRAQNGSLQLYLGYALVALVVLLVLAR